MVYLPIGLMAVAGLTFATSAVSKVRTRAGRREFVMSLRDLRLLPENAVAWVAAAVVVAEGTVALAATVGLVVALLRRPVAPLAGVTLGLAAALLVVLTAGIAMALRRGSTARCACFGPGSRLRRLHVVRNGLLLLAVAAGLVTLLVGSSSPAEPAGVLVSLGAGAVAALCVTRAEDLVDLFSSSRQ